MPSTSSSAAPPLSGSSSWRKKLPFKSSDRSSESTTATATTTFTTAPGRTGSTASTFSTSDSLAPFSPVPGPTMAPLNSPAPGARPGIHVVPPTPAGAGVGHGQMSVPPSPSPSTLSLHRGGTNPARDSNSRPASRARTPQPVQLPPKPQQLARDRASAIPRDSPLSSIIANINSSYEPGASTAGGTATAPTSKTTTPTTRTAANSVSTTATTPTTTSTTTTPTISSPPAVVAPPIPPGPPSRPGTRASTLSTGTSTSRPTSSRHPDKRPATSNTTATLEDIAPWSVYEPPTDPKSTPPASSSSPASSASSRRFPGLSLGSSLGHNGPLPPPPPSPLSLTSPKSSASVNLSAAGRARNNSAQSSSTTRASLFTGHSVSNIAANHFPPPSPHSPSISSPSSQAYPPLRSQKASVSSARVHSSGSGSARTSTSSLAQHQPPPPTFTLTGPIGGEIAAGSNNPPSSATKSRFLRIAGGLLPSRGKSETDLYPSEQQQPKQHPGTDSRPIVVGSTTSHSPTSSAAAASSSGRQSSVRRMFQDRLLGRNASIKSGGENGSSGAVSNGSGSDTSHATYAPSTKSSDNFFASGSYRRSSSSRNNMSIRSGQSGQSSHSSSAPGQQSQSQSQSQPSGKKHHPFSSINPANFNFHHSSHHGSSTSSAAAIALFRQIHATAAKRIATLDYLRKAHEGRIFWLNTLLFTPAEINKFSYFSSARVTRRASAFVLLGFSLPAVLDASGGSAVDYLRALGALLTEFDSFVDRHGEPGSSGSGSLSKGRMGMMFKRGMNAAKPRRASAAESVWGNGGSISAGTSGNNAASAGHSGVTSDSTSASASAGNSGFSTGGRSTPGGSSFSAGTGGSSFFSSSNASTLSHHQNQNQNHASNSTSTHHHHPPEDTKDIFPPPAPYHPHASPFDQSYPSQLQSPIPESYSYLFVVPLPFAPDYQQAFGTLCDCLIDAYARIMDLLPLGEEGMGFGNNGGGTSGLAHSESTANTGRGPSSFSVRTASVPSTSAGKENPNPSGASGTAAGTATPSSSSSGHGFKYWPYGSSSSNNNNGSGSNGNGTNGTLKDAFSSTFSFSSTINANNHHSSSHHPNRTGSANKNGATDGSNGNSGYSPPLDESAPLISDLFTKADVRVKKLLISAVVKEFEDASRNGIRTEVKGLNRVVLGGLM